MTVSNELQTSAFVSTSDMAMKCWHADLAWSRSRTSPELKFPVHKPGKTVAPFKSPTLSVYSLPRRTEISGWRLKTLLLIQVRRTRRESVATTWLEGMVEYGTGKGESEAIADLVVSLGEYRESLEKREKNLGDSARKELDYLRKLVERTGSEQGGLPGTA